MKLYEFRPGAHIVPDLVVAVEGRALNNGMHWYGWTVDATLVGGGTITLESALYVVTRRHTEPSTDMLAARTWNGPWTADAFVAAAVHPAAMWAVWIDERREGLTIVPAQP